MIFDDLCYVQIVTAYRGGVFTARDAMRFGSLQSAIEECERLQGDFDCDAEPKRAFALDAGRVPIWAGGARGRPPSSERPERNPSRGRLLFSNSVT